MTTTRREFLKGSAAAGAALALVPRGFARILDDKKPAPMKILILGGTGFLGPYQVEYALKRGHTLTLFNRGKTHPKLFPDVEKIIGDRDGKLDGLKGRKWDAVIDNSGYVPRHVKDSAELLRDNVASYLFVSTVSVYADTKIQNMDESAPVATIPDPTTEKVTNETYGALKALCEKAAQTAMPGRAMVVRPGLIVGPGDESYRFTYWPVRIDRGGEVLAPGDGNDPIQFIDARDLGEWCVRMVEKPAAGVYNATGPAKPLVMKELVDACVAAAKSNAKITWVPAKFLAEQKVKPWDDLPVWVPRDGEEFGLSTINIKRALAAGLSFRPVVETAKDTLAWAKAQEKEEATDTRAKRRARPGLSAEREAAALAAWHAR
jgi:2'-hydroxyisoflavone reductase